MILHTAGAPGSERHRSKAAKRSCDTTMDPSVSMTPLTAVACRRCGHLGCDVQLQGCGCVLHARCTPLSLVIAEKSNVLSMDETAHLGVIPSPVTSRTTPCPICRVGFVTGIRLFPLAFEDLERAVELRRKTAQEKASKASSTTSSAGEEDSSRKRSRSLDDEVFSQIQAESSYLMLSHTPSSIGGHRHQQDSVSNSSSASSTHRTGRWSNEEIQFVDILVKLFDTSQLPLPHGVKLNDFLGDMLLCKSSRLTKKMRNAKLSTKSYTLSGKNGVMMGAGGLLEDPTLSSTLSTLQETFLHSITSEATQLEMKFNMQKLWRMHFSNLCLQVGYEFLDGSDWLQSLEDMEHRANEAEQFIRKARRRRMSQALKNDTGAHVEHGVFVAGVPANDASMQPPPRVVSSNTMGVASIKATSHPQELPAMDVRQRGFSFMSEVTDSEANMEEEDDDDFLAALELTVTDPSNRSRLFSEDYALALEELADPLAMIPMDKETPAPCLGDCGTFLEEVVGFMETNNVPFQHVDIWVPSFVSDDGKQASPSSGKDGTLRLFHAGHATRSDLDPTLGRQLNEYGVYSTHFSFAPGVGLPGRVYAQGASSWETGIHEADPKIFERAGGAKVYGIKTAMGIAVEAPGIGRIVVSMYGIDETEEDSAIKQLITKEITKWTPEPKWKLVIDLGSSTPSEALAAEEPGHSSQQLMHFSHSEQPSATASIPTPATAAALNTQLVKTKLAHYSHRPRASSAGPEVYSSKQIASSVQKQASIVVPKTQVAEDVVQEIASLLGDHMPVGVGGVANQELVPHFMSLRLLLLRSENRRSAEENELIEIVKKSYQGYSKDNKRCGSELACLIAKDWMYLNPAKPNNSLQQYQSHVMAPTVDSMVSSGAPSVMPASLGNHSTTHQLQANPISFSSLGPLEQQKAQGRGRSHDDSAVVSPRSRSVSASSDISSANIVPEA